MEQSDRSKSKGKPTHKDVAESLGDAKVEIASPTPIVPIAAPKVPGVEPQPVTPQRPDAWTATRLTLNAITFSVPESSRAKFFPMPTLISSGSLMRLAEETGFSDSSIPDSFARQVDVASPGRAGSPVGAVGGTGHVSHNF